MFLAFKSQQNTNFLNFHRRCFECKEFGQRARYKTFMSLFCLFLFYKIKSVYLAVKAEKKTVQFSDEVQVETIEPEPEPVYIDEVSATQVLIFNCGTFKYVMFKLFNLYLKNNLKNQENIVKREWEGEADLIKKKKKSAVF